MDVVRHKCLASYCLKGVWNVYKFRVYYMKIKDIYSSFMQETNGTDVVSTEAQKKIQAILRTQQEKMEWQEYEQYADQIYAATAIAEESGFINGFRCAAILMAECYAGGCNLFQSSDDL